MSQRDEQRPAVDRELVERAIARVGGRATDLCVRLHFGASSVSEWRRGVRRIPKNERLRLKEFVVAQEVPATSADPIEAFASGFGLNPELVRLRQLAPDIVAQEWGSMFLMTVNQARRERDEIMLRMGRALDTYLRLLLKLATHHQQPPPGQRTSHPSGGRRLPAHHRPRYRRSSNAR